VTTDPRQPATGHLLLGLDPSSTVIGYAVMASGGSLVEAGLITPARPSDPSFERVIAMGDDLLSLLDRWRPAVILIEWTKGKVGRRHGGFGAGLAVYGCGVGSAAAFAVLWSRRRPCEVVPVLENTWTRGVPKAERQRGIAAEYPAYAAQMADDPGGDVSDAIGLCDWWRRENLFVGITTETQREGKERYDGKKNKEAGSKQKPSE